MAFGDSDVFYMGKGADGYPLRYPLKGLTIQENVLPFFAHYEESTPQ